MADLTVGCPYCGNAAELVDSSEVYSRSYGMMWLCRSCKAYVGTHRDSKKHKPLGTLANAELRGLRKRVHAELDPIWELLIEQTNCAKHLARNGAYSWLAGLMGIPVGSCHIAMFDVNECRAALTICAQYWAGEIEGPTIRSR